jgi:hypothetical protein
MPLLNLIFDICRLRRGPQDMPYSTSLLAGAAAACVVLQLIVAALRGVPVTDVLGGAILALVFLFVVLQAMLTVRGLRGRFVQTATTLLLCAFLFNLLSLPIVLAAGDPPATPEQMTSIQALVGLIALPLLVWKVVVDAHVLRHSLDLPFFGGLAIAMAWIIAVLLLIKLTGVPAG